MNDHEYRQHWFNNYTYVKTGFHEALVENDGTVEIEIEMDYAGYARVLLTVEDLERLAAVARTMRDYHASRASGPLGMSESGFAGTDEEIES